MKAEIIARFDYLRDRLRLLPRPEKEEDKFLASFNNLSQEQIRAVIAEVIEQARESRKYGLYVDRQLLYKEERFYLFLLDTYGGVDKMVAEHKFEEVSQTMAELCAKVFANEKKLYFVKFSQIKDGGSNNRYEVHLENIRTNILRRAYNHDLER